MSAEAGRPLRAGAAVAEITPVDRQFLWGYPHVERYSTGVHDPLLSSALYLADGQTELLFIANDIIFIGKATADRVRRRIADVASIPPSHIIISATHTHSGPMTVDILSNEADGAVPRTDPAYLRQVEDRIVEAALEACRTAQPAELGLALADGGGVGTNRRDPAGVRDPEAPVLAVRSAGGGRYIAAMIVCSMHPTVLHEDSTLISGDFPAMARQYVQQRVLGIDCPVLYHTGPCGNLSPRHVTTGNTFEEATRLGHILGRAVREALGGIRYSRKVTLEARQSFADLPRRVFPSVLEAEAGLRRAAQRLEALQTGGAPRAEIRTGECDWFGAEETVALARAAAEGRLATACDACMPAEIQVLRVGPWSFVAWPGELFVEYALAVKAKSPHTYMVSLANGELQGYIVTAEAAAEGGYEASNAVFSHAGGELLVERTLRLLAGGPDKR